MDTIALRKKRCKFDICACKGCVFKPEDGYEDTTCGVESRISNPKDPLYCGEQGEKSRIIWVIDRKR